MWLLTGPTFIETNRALDTDDGPFDRFHLYLHAFFRKNIVLEGHGYHSID
jgi:hypothetical protein